MQVAARDFPTNRGGLCRKGWTSAALLRLARAAHHPAGARRQGRPAAPGVVGRGARPRRRRPAPRRRRPAARTRSAVFGGGGLTNEKAYLLGKLARVVLRHRARSTTTAASACRPRPPARPGRSGSTAACRSRSSDVGEADCVLLVGSNVAETMPPFVQHLARGRGARRQRSSSSTRAAPRRPRPPTCTCSRSPAPTWPWPTGCCSWPIEEGAGRRGVRRGPHHRLGGRAADRRGVLAGAGRAADRRPRARPARGVRLLGAADRALVLTARGAEQHSHGTDTVSRFDQPGARPRPARARGLRLGLPHRAGQRPGRARARAEGRPAARLPQHRRPGRPRPRRGRLGRRPGRAARPRPVGVRAARRPRHRRRPAALLLIGSNPVVSAPRAGHVARAARRLDHLVVADVVLSETAATRRRRPARRAVGGGGRHHDQPGGPGAAAARAVDPPPGVRTDLEVLAGAGRPAGVPDRLPRRPARGLRRAAPGQRGRRRRLRRHHLRAARGGGGAALAVPVAEDHPGTPRLFLDRFATTDGRARFVAGRAARAGRAGRRRPARCYLTTGRVAAQYQSGAQTRRVAALQRGGAGAVRRAAPAPGRAARGRATASGCGVSTRRGAAWLRGAGHRHDPGGHRLRAVPLGRPRPRQPADQRRARPGLADAVVQGLRRADRPALVGSTRGDARRRGRQRHGRRPGRRRAAAAATRDADVTVFGAEDRPAYNRILLSDVLAGRRRTGDIALAARAGPRRPPPRDRGRRASTGRPGVVHAADGTSTPYDALVLATGSTAVVPPVQGIAGRRRAAAAPGCTSSAPLDDCDAITAEAGRARRAVVVGGGLLGLEAARGLLRHGLQRRPRARRRHLMDAQLDAAGGAVLRRAVEALGVGVHVGRTRVRRSPAGAGSPASGSPTGGSVARRPRRARLRRPAR